jgi:predicted nucleic acid-binding protein
MGQYLIDTNIISNYFSGNFSNNAMIFIGEIIDQTPIISVISEIEALSWINADKNKENIVREFITDSNVLNLTSEIVALTIKIRREKKTKTPDAIIAATAIANNLILLTNDNDFNAIKNLKLLNPFSL